MSDVLNSGFVSPNLNYPKLVSTAKKSAEQNQSNLRKVVQDVAMEGLSQATGLNSETVSAISDIANLASNILGANATPSVNFEGGGGAPGSGGRGDKPIGPNTLSFKTNPVKVDFKTDIVTNAYPMTFHEPSNINSPLHITGACVLLPNTTDMDNYFERKIFNDFSIAIQGAISFSLPSFFTPVALKEYFNNVLEALQVYYFYDSVVNFTANYQNTNAGMLNIKDNLSANELNGLTNLKYMLSGFPIPPNMLSLCYFLNQTYSTGVNRGSSLIKFSPVPWAFDGGSGLTSDTQYINYMLDKLAGSRDMAQIINRACPKWLMANLPGSQDLPSYSEEFMTVFANAVFSTTNSAGTITTRNNTVSLPNVDIPYSCFTNELDGALYALTSPYFNEFTPGIMEPRVATNDDASMHNRWSFINGSVWATPTTANEEFFLARPETSRNISTTALTTNICYGASKLLGVNVNSITQTAYSMVSWLCSSDTIGQQRDNRIYKSRRRGR